MLRPRVCAFLILWLAASASADAVEFTGRVGSVIDGDDMKLCAAGVCTRIRLCGIDAPEAECPGHSEAHAALRALVEGKNIRCIQVGGGTVCDGRSKPRIGHRIVAQCFLDGVDVAARLVEIGLACDWTKFSGGYYSRSGKGRACPHIHRATCAAVAPSVNRE